MPDPKRTNRGIPAKGKLVFPAPAAYLVYFLLVFTPLAFGTVEPWSYAMMETAIAVAALFYLTSLLRKNAPLYRVPGILPLILLLGFILLQLIPLPAPIVNIISPKAFEIHNTASYLTGMPAPLMPLSIHPRTTLIELLRFCSYVLFYVLTVQMLGEKIRLKQTAWLVLVFGALLSFFSILEQYLAGDALFWFWDSPPNSTGFGPYVNRNHFAGLMEMIFPIALSLFFFYRPRTGSRSLFKALVEMLSQEKANIHILIGGASLLIITSIFLSISRGGIISICLSLFFFTYALSKHRVTRKNTGFVLVLFILVGLSIGWFGWGPIVERFSQLKEIGPDLNIGRFFYWTDSLAIIRDFPFLGSGFGTFASIHPSYQSFLTSRTLTHAHNDYLEFAVHGGVVTLMLMGWFLVSFFIATRRAYLLRRDAFCIFLYIGSITGMISILFHSVTDFNLQIGANGLWFFLTAGIAVSAAHTNIRNTSAPPTRLAQVRGMKKNWACIGALVCSVFILVCNICLQTGQFYHSNIKDVKMTRQTPNHDLEAIFKIADLASRFDPLNAGYLFSKAIASRLMNQSDADNYLNTMIRLAPANATSFKTFALLKARDGQDVIAGKAFEKSVTYDISDPDTRLDYGSWLLLNGKQKKGIASLRRALELNPKRIDQVLSAMALAGIPLKEMEAAVPDKAYAAVGFADFLNDTGRRQSAARKYLHALDMMDSEHQQKNRLYLKAVRFFMKRQDWSTSLQVLQRAEKALPSDIGIKIYFGDYYKARGILYKAREKYESALLIAPKNRTVLRRLRKLNR
jgi:O-antigen ligase/Tfp pilus assembly protein PilF